MDRATEIGLAHIARGAWPAIDDSSANSRAGEERRRVVRSVVGITKSDAVEGDVELAIGEAAHIGGIDVPHAATIRAKAVHRRRDHHGGGVVAAFRGRLLDEFVGD